MKVFHLQKQKPAMCKLLHIRQSAAVLSCLLVLITFAFSAVVFPQSINPVIAQIGPGITPTPSGNETPIPAPNQVNIKPSARDEEIRTRLKSILQATGWFNNPQVKVQEGVVFLKGQTDSTEYKQWAGNLARNTQDVVAVVNQIELTQPAIWDFRPALTGLRTLWQNFKRSIPLLGFSLLVLIITWIITRLSIFATRVSLRRRITSPLLRNVLSYAVGTIVFLLGLYLVLQVAGLTNVALTVVGGTGLIGLVVGIAFRDITENFLASIFLSIQNPFRSGDLVEIVGVTGYVQAMTTRATSLMTLDGTLVQIPNATVYKNNIYNYSSNPNRRVDFQVGIGYDNAIPKVQAIALQVLNEHPAVLKDPEPWVLVDSLSSATVNLCIYFWLDGSQHSWLKVKSSVIRLVKRAFQMEGISMPDEAREVVFPKGVPIRQVETTDHQQTIHSAQKPATPLEVEEPASVSTDAEGDLNSEAGVIQDQASHAWKPDQGENLLKFS
jgi:small conductance mechanosensitive channel